MNDKEKIDAIREEIETLIKRIALRDETDSNLMAVYGGQVYILVKVLRFIDSLID